jgi:DegV family protein with EDD domain
MSIAIVTDTACNITPAQAEELGIYLIPLEINIDGQNYKDGFDIDTKEFYEKMAEAQDIPTTSQPKAGNAYDLYQKLSKEYDEILSIHLGSSVSGTVQSLRLVREEIEDAEITIYDTQLVSVPAGYLVLEAKRLVDEGKELSEIIDHLNAIRDKSIAFAAVHSLDNLVESGRVPAVVGTVAKLAKIKPLLTIKAQEEKGLDITEKVRTSKRANKKLVTLATEYIETLDYPFQVDVAHGNAPETAEKIKKELEALYPEQNINTHRLTGVIGAHSGPEIIGIFIAPKLKEMV